MIQSRQYLRYYLQQMQAHNSDSSSPLDDLFKIGGRTIMAEPEKKSSKAKEGYSSQSRSKSKNKKIKKEKKQKDKDHKKEKKKKQRKEKKQKRKIQDFQAQLLEDKNKDLIKNSEDQILLKQQRQLAIYTKYEKQMTAHLQKQQNVSEKQFTLKFKQSQRALPIDVIRFGIPQLSLYGLQDRDIPFYKRPFGQIFPNKRLSKVLGLKKKPNKMKKILKQLNAKTNQNTVDWKKRQAESYERYYHFTGYDTLSTTRIQRYIIPSNEQSLGTQISHLAFIKATIPYELPAGTSRMQTHQQQIRVINKEYNFALNENPQNVGLWKKFISIQEKLFYLTLTATSLSVQKDQQYKTALNERKQAILQKALFHNPNNLDLSIVHIQLLLEANKERKFIEDKIRELIQVHSESWPLWKLYLQFKLSNFLQFSHTRLVKDYQEIMQYLLQNRMAQAKSGKEVWRIRKCGLLLTAKVLQVHRMEGYAELCTAICSALIEFNILANPACRNMEQAERLKIFEEYWENHSNYKLGQITQTPQTYIPGMGYQVSQESQKLFIKQRMKNIFEISQKKSEEMLSWMPSHLKHQQPRIQKDPRSFILFEDISPFIQVYRTEENLQLLTDIFMENLGLPVIYGQTNSLESVNVLGISQFNLEWLESSLMAHESKPLLHGSSSFGLWARYWHPDLASQFLAVEKSAKLIYAITVLETLRTHYNQENKENYYASLKAPILEYLFFIYGVVFYLQRGHPALRKYLSSDQAKDKIHQILGQEPTNPNLWALYIELESLAGKTQKQCIDCFGNWIGGLNHLHNDPQQLIYAKLQVAYWLSTFIKRLDCLRSSMSAAIVYCLKSLILDKDKSEDLPTRILELLSSNVLVIGATPMELLLMGNQLLQILKSLAKVGDSSASKYKCFIYYFLLELGQNPKPIIQNLIKSRTELGINILMDFNLLTLENITSSGLLASPSLLNNLKFMQYFLTLLARPCPSLPCFYQLHFKHHCETIRTPYRQAGSEDYTEDENQNIVYMWLMAMRVWQPYYAQNLPAELLYFMEYFLKTARKKIITPLRMSQEPGPVVILNKFMSDPDYALYCLDRLPYCKKLYRTAILNPSLGTKLETLALQKQIRLREQQGISHERM